MAMRSESDFAPSLMGSPPARQQSKPSRQLDFFQAMADFKTMFPTMDNEVIEAVLRANDGAVDATIDQLLTMSIDNDDEFPGLSDVIINDRLDGQADDTRSFASLDGDENALEDPPPYSEAVKTNPPPRHLAVSGDHSPNRHHVKRGDSFGKSPHKLSSDSSIKPKKSASFRTASHTTNVSELETAILNMDLTDLHTLSSVDNGNTTPKSYYDSSSTASPLHRTSKLPNIAHRTKLSSIGSKRYRNWNPPVLGNLPDDFLRLSPQPSPAWQQEHPSQNERLSLEKIHASQVERSRSFGGHEISRTMLQRKLEDNERRRRSANTDVDPDLTQFLADERMAILLQNSEFLAELRQNTDFMKTLENDRMNAGAFELPSDPASPPTTMEQAPITEPQPTDTDQPPITLSNDKPIRNKHSPEIEIEGYGEDRQNSLGAFPFTQKIDAKDEDAELRKQLGNMSRSTRKQFAAIAKKFSRKKKKSSKQILRESIAPSMANLLDEEEISEATHQNNTDGNTQSRHSYDDNVTQSRLSYTDNATRSRQSSGRQASSERQVSWTQPLPGSPRYQRDMV